MFSSRGAEAGGAARSAACIGRDQGPETGFGWLRISFRWPVCSRKANFSLALTLLWAPLLARELRVVQELHVAPEPRVARELHAWPEPGGVRARHVLPGRAAREAGVEGRTFAPGVTAFWLLPERHAPRGLSAFELQPLAQTLCWGGSRPSSQLGERAFAL